MSDEPARKEPGRRDMLLRGHGTGRYSRRNLGSFIAIECSDGADGHFRPKAQYPVHHGRGGESRNDLGGGYMNDFMAREFRRFVQVQQTVAKLAATAIDYPPMQAPASFNLQAIKEKIDAVARSHEGQ